MFTVAWMTASRSCELSPKDNTFLRLWGSGPRTRPISASKARSFHSNGEVRCNLSYSDRADSSFTLSSIGAKEGRNFAQLISIHPRSAFVTSTTVPNCFARLSVEDARRASSSSCSHCNAVGIDSRSRRSPCSWTHEDGCTVSSQSKIRTVSSAENRAPSTASALASPTDAQASADAPAAALAARRCSSSCCCCCCRCCDLSSPSAAKAGCSSDGIASSSSPSARGDS
mmetsp:Transcript_58762/g.154778  ORF Transcript_58762/g.154778 Transcript_58762/m.154778 type:complete len:228 (-) Transcript_58762:152-835(-)